MKTHYITSKDGSKVFNFDAMKWEQRGPVTVANLFDGGFMGRKSAEINALVNCVDLGGAVMVYPKP